MGLKRIEEVVKGSNIIVHNTLVVKHFVYVTLDNVNVLIMKSKRKWSEPYVCLYSMSKDGKYAGRIDLPEINFLPELRRLSSLTEKEVKSLIKQNRR